MKVQKMKYLDQTFIKIVLTWFIFFVIICAGMIWEIRQQEKDVSLSGISHSSMTPVLFMYYD